jgi:hypothetical protein
MFEITLSELVLELQRRIEKYQSQVSTPNVSERDADLIRGRIVECKDLIKKYSQK